MSSGRPRFVWRDQQLGMLYHQPYSFHESFMAPDEMLLAKKMSEDAVRGRWTNIYAAYPENTKLTLHLRGKDTVLHYAVLEAETYVVKTLVEMLNDENLRNETLLLRDEGGNTPLHLAAARGDKEMCSFLANFNPRTLITATNLRGETPLFVAVVHGKKDAFFTLYDMLKEAGAGEEIHNSCFRRKEDGDSILHVAIALEHFELAYQVIQERRDLVEMHNAEGESVLDVLASHPRAFKSCDNLGPMDWIIYTFVPTDPLRKRPRHENKPVLQQRRQSEQRGCIHRLLENMANHLEGKLWVPKRDVENPNPRPRNINQRRKGTARVLLHLMSLIFFDLMTLAIDTWRIWKIKENKTRYSWAVLVLDEVFKQIGKNEDYHADGRLPNKYMLYNQGLRPSSADGGLPDKLMLYYQGLRPPTEAFQQQVEGFQPLPEEVSQSIGEGDGPARGKEKPILIAAKNGIVEVVEKILDQYPLAIHDVDEDGKNAVLIAAEKGHGRVYRLLTARKYKKESAFRERDHEGNSALHLAAKRSENRPWNIPGAALELQCEFKWFKYIEESMGENFFTCLNENGQTPKQIFDEAHQALVKEGSEWLVTTSQAASAIAVLVATLAYTSITSVPGSFDENEKTPVLGDQRSFNVFVVANFLGLCFSMTSITMYVDIFSSHHPIDDFESKLPRKFANALTFLFLSILSLLVSFFAAFAFVMQKQLRPIIYPLSYVAVFPLVIWMASKLPFYLRLLKINYGQAPLIVYY